MTRNTCVNVNTGTGCIFKLYDSQYDYILTAKHLLLEENVISWFNPTVQEKVKLDIISTPLIHETVDAAIILVKKIKDLGSFHTVCNKSQGENIVLSGFPNCRTFPNDFRTNHGVTHGYNSDGLLEIELNGSPIFEEVDGMSGGPITKKYDEDSLIAIQSQMIAKDETENLGRTLAVPMSFYEEIISKENSRHNENDLEGLVNVGLNKIINHTFELSDLEFKKGLVTKCLRAKAQKVSQSLTIDDIKSVYENNLSLQEYDDIHDRKFWVGFLETLSVKSFQCENAINKQELEKIKSSLKVVYGEVDKLWREAIPALYSSNLESLKKGSKVFVVTNNDIKPPRIEYEPNMLMNIHDVPVEEMQIDRASIQDPFKDIKIRHIYSIEKAMIEKESTFMECNAATIGKAMVEAANDIL